MESAGQGGLVAWSLFHGIGQKHAASAEGFLAGVVGIDGTMRARLCPRVLQCSWWAGCQPLGRRQVQYRLGVLDSPSSTSSIALASAPLLAPGHDFPHSGLQRVTLLPCWRAKGRPGRPRQSPCTTVYSQPDRGLNRLAERPAAWTCTSRYFAATCFRARHSNLTARANCFISTSANTRSNRQTRAGSKSLPGLPA